MILEPIRTENPFGDPHLFWCEAGFTAGDVQALHHDGPLGPASLHLPDDLTQAVPKRRSEFLAGRLMAALALRQAGLPEAVGRAGRAPVWPEGVAGSITHSKDRAIAAVSTRYRGLGLDCEALVTTDRAMQLAATIFSETEAQLRPDALPFGTFFTLVFSAKEAVYKALSPRLTRIPGFHEAALTALQPGEMQVEMHGQSHRIRFRLSAKDCVTLVTQQGD
jgi:enterobactin synthetase component D